MQLSVTSLNGSPVRSVTSPHQPSTTARLLAAERSRMAEEHSSLLEAVAANATSAHGEKTSPVGRVAAVPPLHADSLFLSSILSGGPSPMSEWSNKTLKHVPPLSSSAHPSQRRFSADSETHRGEDASPARREARNVVSSQSAAESSTLSRRSEGGSPYTTSRTNDTMQPDSHSSPPQQRVTGRSAGVSVNLDEAFFAAAEPEVSGRAVAAVGTTVAALSPPPKYTRIGGRLGAPSSAAVVGTSTPPVVVDPTSPNSASAWLADALHRSSRGGGGGAGDGDHLLYLSPLSSVHSGNDDNSADVTADENNDSDGSGNPDSARHHRSGVRRSLFDDDTAAAASASQGIGSTPPPSEPTAGVAKRGIFGVQYGLYEPAALSPSQHSLRTDVALVSPSQADLATDVFMEFDGPHQRQSMALFRRAGSTADGYSSPSSPLPPLQRKVTRAFDTSAGAGSATTPLRSLVGRASAIYKAPAGEMDTQVFPGTPLFATPAPLHAQRLPSGTGTWAAPAAETARWGLASADSAPWCTPSYAARCTTAPLQATGRVVDDAPHHIPTSPHTPRDLSAVRSISRSLSVASSAAAASFSGLSVGGRVGGATATTPMASASHEEADRCSTPKSPHTPVTNRTPGPLGLHDSCLTQRSHAHSHSRYRSQMLSQPITPQKSARHAFSRQTTPSQSFRSKVRSHSFECQRLPLPGASLHPVDAVSSASHLRVCPSPVRDDEAERDYLAPSRNPFSLFRTLEPYATAFAQHGAPELPGGACDSPVSENGLSERQLVLVAGLQTTAVRPDAAVVLYGHVVPAPLHPPAVAHSAEAEMHPSCGSPASLALLRHATEPRPSPMTLSLSAGFRSTTAEGHAWSALPESEAVRSAEPAGVSHSRARQSAAPRSPTSASPQILSPADAEVPRCECHPALVSPPTPAAIHLGSPSQLVLPRIAPLAAQSLFCTTASPATGSAAASHGTPPHGTSAAASSADSSGTPRRAVTPRPRSPDGPQHRSGRVTSGSSSSSSSEEASPLPRCPAVECATSVLSHRGGATPCADRQLHLSDAGDSDEESHLSGPTDGGVGGPAAHVHAGAPLDPREESHDSAWSSHGSPNCLRQTVANVGACASRQPSPARLVDAVQVSTTAVAPQMLERGEPAVAVASLVPSLNLACLVNDTPRLQFPAPALRQWRSPARESPGVRRSSDSAWMRGTPTPTVAGAGRPLSSRSAGVVLGSLVMEAFADPAETTATSEEEEVAGDRFQAHHVFQFMHAVAPSSRGGDVLDAAPVPPHRPIPLYVETNGVAWLAVHRLSGQPYVVKEVPAAAFNAAELRCLTLSIGAPVKQTGTAAAPSLSAVDRLEAEDLLVRYYGVCTPPLDGTGPEVHLLQLEYFPRGSLHELVHRRSHRAPHDAPSCLLSGSALDCAFWHQVVTQGLRGLRVLHHAGLVHGCPLPTALFLCGNTAASVRVKWGCLGGARADADVYPTESLPAWLSETAARLHRPTDDDDDRGGGSSISAAAVEVAVFCLGLLQLLVDHVSACLPGVILSCAPQNVSEVKWLETFSSAPDFLLHRDEDSAAVPGDVRSLKRLMRFLWEASSGSHTADEVLAQLHAPVDPFSSVVEQLYEYELARLVRQVEERQRRRQRTGHREERRRASRASDAETASLRDAELHRSPVLAAADTAGLLARRHVGIHASSHPAPRLLDAVTPTSSSSCSSSPAAGQTFSRSPHGASRRPQCHTLQERPLTIAGRLCLPSASAAASSAPAASLCVEHGMMTMSPVWCGSGGSGGALPSYGRRSEPHPRIIAAASHMLLRAVQSRAGGDPDTEDVGVVAAVSSPLPLLLWPAITSMRLRGWTMLHDGVPLTATGDTHTDTSATLAELLGALRPLTSFE
ncbi:hypothetical protein NESM_000435800 [Novymonas esmeraldas]|uniref:Protein kinase domain-containing protein n=1 Tax=Novymonas esmeraldas TaxID=1808958 RepID=A0AAW0EM54_9TRYP